MIKFLPFLMAVFLLSQPLFSQPQINVTMGQEQQASKRGSLEDVVGYDETGCYVLRSDRRDLFIEHYDRQMNRKNSVELDLQQDKKEKDLEFIVQLGKQLYLFSSFDNQKLDKNFLFVQTINKQTLKPNADIQNIAEIGFKRKRNAGTYSYRVSPDSSKVLIFYSLPYEKGEPEKFGFSVFDKNMKLMWKKDVKLPYNDELFSVDKFKVDNNGNVYLLGLVYREKAKKKRHGKPNYQYHVLAYSGGGNIFNEYKVDLRDKFITDMQIGIRTNGDISCAGFYSEKGTFSIKGTFFLTLDANSKKTKKENLKEFDKDFLEEFMSDSKAKRGKELYEYDLDRLVLREDGGAVLVAEQYYIHVSTYTTSTGTGMMTTRTVYYYNYNDLVVININPDGSIQWARKIPKRQVTANDGGYFSSYTFSLINNKMYFIFNDNPKNLANPNPDKIYNYNPKSSVVTVVEIDKNGNMNKQALFKAKEAKIITRPKVCEQVSGNEVIVFGQKKSKYKFARLIFG